MDKVSTTLGMEQDKRLRKRWAGGMGAGVLIALLVLGLARVFGWTVLTGFVLGSLLVEVGLAGLLVGIALLIVWVLTHAGKARPSLHHLARVNAPAEEVAFPDQMGD